MNYVKMDPRRHSKPKSLRAGWWAMRVFELLVDVSAKYDLRGALAKDYYDPTFLAHEWNLREADIDADPIAALVNAMSRLTQEGLIQWDGDTVVITAWDEFYGPKDHSTERVQRFRRKKAGTEAASDETVETLQDSTRQDTTNTGLSTSEVVGAWNDFAARTTSKKGKPLSQVQKVAGERARLLSARIAEYPDLSTWQEALTKARTIPGLLGANNREWVMDFDWLIQPMSIAKLMEGKYDRWGRTEDVQVIAPGVALYGPGGE